MGWPQVTMIVLFAISFTIAVIKHGNSHPEYNAGNTAISIVIELVILYFGGFFN